MLDSPFINLSPDAVWDSLQALDIEGDGRIFELNSYENRVYQVGSPTHGALVVKFYRPGRWSDAQIEEEHAFSLELVAADLPVIAPLQLNGQTLHHIEGRRLAVFPRAVARAPDLEAAGALELLGRTLGRFHAIGERKKFDYRGRLSLVKPVQHTWFESFGDPAVCERYLEVFETLSEAIEEAFDDFGDVDEVRLHGDFHLGNVLWNEQGPVIVDLDDTMSGPRMQDLWMLLSGTKPERASQWRVLMQGYRQFHHIDERELDLVEALRGLRMLRHASWISERWTDPAFPRAFVGFDQPRYWQDYLSDLWQQVELVGLR
jgi:Ser/Thr protein kinase RdoA (MazF antagonist)